MSSPADLVLFAALIATTSSVVMLHLRLRRLDRLNADYGRALAEAARALGAARDSLATFTGDGREVLVLLNDRIESAHGLIAEMDARAQEVAPVQGFAPAGRR